MLLDPYPDSSLVFKRIAAVGQAVVDDLVSKGDVAIYLFLQERAASTSNLASDAVFKLVYRRFYRLRPELGKEFDERYFELFELERKTNAPDVSKIVAALCAYGTRGKPVVHFSFATKMAATLNPAFAIYDSNIVALLELPHPFGEPGTRLARYQDNYRRIQQVIEDAHSSSIVSPIITELNRQISDWSRLHPTKQIDFILWKAGDVINKIQPRQDQANEEGA